MLLKFKVAQLCKAWYDCIVAVDKVVAAEVCDATKARLHY